MCIFMHEVDPSDDEGVTLNDLLKMLEKKTGEVFERKSIYSDISKINEYVAASGRYKGTEFIYREGNRYLRDELEDEILLDEARLISDSLRTTRFVPESIYGKFEDMFPAFFRNDQGGDSARLYPRYNKGKKNSDNQTKYLLSYIRENIKHNSPVRIRYGYKVTSTVVGSDFVVTPLVLDWTNDRYYLIAIDNMTLYDKTGFEKQATDQELAGCIKRFRLDRIDKRPSAVPSSGNALKYIKDNLPDHYGKLFGAKTKLPAARKHEIAGEYLKYHGFSDSQAKRKHISSYLNNSFEGFSSSFNVITIRMTLESKDKTAPNAWKNVLQAFSVFKDEFTIASGSIAEQESEKRITFAIEAPDVPPLYKFLFSIYTFDTVSLTIDNPAVREEFRKYLTRALEALQ